MTTAQVGYAPVYRWVKHILGRTHSTVIVTVAWAVLCVLVAQRVPPAALARAWPAEQAGSSRSCLRRVRRWWCGPALERATISRALIRLALALRAARQPVVVALDTIRLGGWEIWMAGIVVAGRTRPVGWVVLPWSSGRGGRWRWVAGGPTSPSCQGGWSSARRCCHRPSRTRARGASGPSWPRRIPNIGSTSRAARRSPRVRRPSPMRRSAANEVAECPRADGDMGFDAKTTARSQGRGWSDPDAEAA